MIAHLQCSQPQCDGMMQIKAEQMHFLYIVVLSQICPVLFVLRRSEKKVLGVLSSTELKKN